MSEAIELDDEIIEEESVDMPSKKHSTAQTNITGLLYNDERFTTFVELTLDTTKLDLTQFGIKDKDGLVPDVCAYLEPPGDDDELSDEIRVTKMPDLAIEVLSPRQTITDL